MNERGLWVRFIHRSGSAALTQQDRLRKCSLTIVAARTALTRTTQQTGQHHDQQQPESSGQKLYVPGVDRGSPKELLGVMVYRTVGRRKSTPAYEVTLPGRARGLSA